MASERAEEYAERGLFLVEQVTPGRVTTHGLIARVVGGGPRHELPEGLFLTMWWIRRTTYVAAAPWS